MPQNALWVEQGASQLSSNIQTNQRHLEVNMFPFFLFIFQAQTIFSSYVIIINFIVLIKHEQCWFILNLIKVRLPVQYPTVYSKSNHLLIWFTQGSIHLHWRQLGTICGYLACSRRKSKDDGDDGMSKPIRERSKDDMKRKKREWKCRSGSKRRWSKERDNGKVVMEWHNHGHRWKSLY